MLDENRQQWGVLKHGRGKMIKGIGFDWWGSVQTWKNEGERGGGGVDVKETQAFFASFRKGVLFWILRQPSLLTQSHMGGFM